MRGFFAIGVVCKYLFILRYVFCAALSRSAPGRDGCGHVFDISRFHRISAKYDNVENASCAFLSSRFSIGSGGHPSCRRVLHGKSGGNVHAPRDVDTGDLDWMEKVPLELFNIPEGMPPNERDKLMQLCDKVMEHAKGANSMNEAFKNMEIEANNPFTTHMQVALARHLLRKPEPPNEFITGLLYETGLLSWYHSYMNAPKKHKNGHPFGIEPRTLEGQKLVPMSETALLGMVGGMYYDHLRAMSVDNPSMAKKILSVIYSIYVRPVLVTDEKNVEFASDHDVVNDFNSIVKAQSESFSNFLKLYPNMKWPSTDEEMLSLYATIFKEPLTLNGDVVEALKNSYGQGKVWSCEEKFSKMFVIPAVCAAACGAIGAYPVSKVLRQTLCKLWGLEGLDLWKNYCQPLPVGIGMACLGFLGTSKFFRPSPGQVFEHLLTGLESVNGVISVDKFQRCLDELVDLVHSGNLTVGAMSEALEELVIVVILKGYRKLLQFGDHLCINDYNMIVEQTRQIAAMSLPLAGVSVYRVMYRVGSELVASDDLPFAMGHEVLGTDISGLPEFEDDDYTQLYKDAREKYDLPEPNVEAYRTKAMLLANLAIDCLGTIEAPIITASYAEGDQDRVADAKTVGFTEAETSTCVQMPHLPSTLDEIEEFVHSLVENKGQIKRIELKRTYGLDTWDDFHGPTPREKRVMDSIRLQENRDAFIHPFKTKGHILELAKSLSMTYHVPEEWLLDEITKTREKLYVDAISNDIENPNINLSEEINALNHIDEYNSSIKWLALCKYGEGLKNENLNHIYDSIIGAATALGLELETAKDAFRVLTFQQLLQALNVLDLTDVKTEQLQDIFKQFHCNDQVFVTALCEVVKRFSGNVKKQLVVANRLRNWYQIEKHLGSLLNARKNVVNSVVDMMISNVQWYKIDRAFRNNMEYTEFPKLTSDEILGRGEKLEAVGGDWELLDPPSKISDMEASRKEWEESTKIDEPIQVYGVDNETSFVEQMRLNKLIEEGKIDKKFQCIPTEFHFGEDEEDKDIDEQPPLVDPMEAYKPIINSQNAYFSWVAYCYRKRQASTADIEGIQSLFPFMSRLIKSSDDDWRRLYVAQRLKEPDCLASKPPKWDTELGCNKAEAQRTCAIQYELEFLKETGAVVGHVYDDVGNVESPYFSPFEPSVYDRMHYLYSLKLPDTNATQRLDKIRTFLGVSEENAQEIHSKCLHYAFGRFINSTAFQESRKPWDTIVNEIIYPKARELKLSKLSVDAVVVKCMHDFLKFKVLELTDHPEPTAAYLARCKAALKFLESSGLFEKKPGSWRLPFTIRAETWGMQEEILSNFILASFESENFIDLDALEKFCLAFGLAGNSLKRFLHKLGRRFYFKYLDDHHHQKYANIDSLKPLQKLHKAYKFTKNDLEDVIRTYREVTLLRRYAPTDGIDGLRFLCSIIDFETISKYNYFEKHRRAHWLINCLIDLTKGGGGDDNDYYKGNSPTGATPQILKEANSDNEDEQDEFVPLNFRLEEFYQLDTSFLKAPIDKYSFGTLAETLKTICHVLEIDNKMYEFACINFAYENIPNMFSSTIEAIQLEDINRAAQKLEILLKAASMVPQNIIYWGETAQKFKVSPREIQKVEQLLESAVATSPETLEHSRHLLRSILTS